MNQLTCPGNKGLFQQAIVESGRVGDAEIHEAVRRAREMPIPKGRELLDVVDQDYVLDEYGRYLPSPTRFPSCMVDGQNQGFRALADRLQLAGFDIALAQRIADNLGLELKVVPMDFDGILMELQNGNIDLGISGFSPSPERAETFDFSDLYYMGGQSFVIRVADKDKYTDYAAFDGLPVGAQTGSIQMGLAEENTPNANIIGLPKVTDLINELLSGKLEGAFIETAVAEQYIKNYPDLMIAWEVPYDTEGSAIALKKGNDGLREAVNGVIKEVLADGSMDEYIATAQDQASDEGNVYEGMLDENGEVQESADEAATEAAAE